MSERQDDKSFTEKAGVAPKTLPITCSFSASLLSSWTTWNWLMSRFSSAVPCIALPFSIVLAGGTNPSPSWSTSSVDAAASPRASSAQFLSSTVFHPGGIHAVLRHCRTLCTLTLFTEDSTIISTTSLHSFPFKDLTGPTLTRLHLAMFLKNKHLLAVTELWRNTHWLSLFVWCHKEQWFISCHGVTACTPPDGLFFSSSFFLHGTLVQAQLQMFCACDVGYCSHLFGITAAALIWCRPTTTAIIYFIFLFPSWWWGHTVIMIMECV